MSTKKLFEVDGFEVKSDTRYVISDRVDYNAPSGFSSKGVTKLPSDGVGETFGCPFRSQGETGEGVWDTGFYVESPCYVSISKTEASAIVKGLDKNLVEQYGRYVGGSDKLSHLNNDFWDSKKFQVFSGQSLSTDSIEDLMTIYFALRQRKVTPKGKEGDAKYRGVSYLIVDVNENVKKRDEKALKKFDAIGKFQGMLKTDKSTLISILSYMDIPVADDVKDSTLIGMFSNQIESSEPTLDRFNKVFDMADTEQGREVIQVFLGLKVMSRKGKLEKVNSVYYFEGEELGPDLKTAAENTVKNKALKELKNLIILGEDDD
jgi:hypothetical protein